MIDKTHELSISAQCRILELPRSTAYYQPAPESSENLALMRRIDELHLEFPFAGARMLRDLLRPEGIRAGRKRIGRLMAKMGIEALYRKPNTSKKGPGHRIYPYLLRDLTIDRPNQVWAADITYIPMRRGFAYLVAVVDWFSRKVLSWRISNTLTTDFCLDAVNEAIHEHGTPEISTPIRAANSPAPTYDSVSQAKAGLAKYFTLYNTRRPHSSFDGMPPDQTYFGSLPKIRIAA